MDLQVSSSSLFNLLCKYAFVFCAQTKIYKEILFNYYYYYFYYHHQYLFIYLFSATCFYYSYLGQKFHTSCYCYSNNVPY